MDTLKIKLYRSRHGGRWDNEYLRKKGMKIGKNVQIYADKIDLPYAALIEIGDDVIVSTASLMAHDASTKLISDYVKIAKVKIGSRVFIGHSAEIMPGVSIGDDVIIGAGAVVTRDIPSNSVAVGAPAKVISTFEEWKEKNLSQMDASPKSEKRYNELSQEELLSLVEKGIGFIR